MSHLDSIMEFMKDASLTNFLKLQPHQEAMIKALDKKTKKAKTRRPPLPKSGGKITTGSADHSMGKGCDLIIIDDPFNQDPPTKEQKDALREIYSDRLKGGE